MRNKKNTVGECDVIDRLTQRIRQWQEKTRDALPL
jgi:hypothetical protein